MANETILIDDVIKELNTYLKNNPELISVGINRAEIPLDMHTKPLTKVKGKYPQAHTLLTDVVQGFSTEWNELGLMRIKHKILQNYHQKVNFAIIPAEILSSYFAELYAENKKPEDMPISKYIVDNELLPKVIDNLAWLSVNGEFDPAKLDEFGYSMNGIVNILDAMIAAVVDVDMKNPTPFKVPISALTDSNIVDQITAWERKLPSKLKRKIKKVFMSENNVERYILQYEEQFGQNQFQKDVLKTRLGKREIVAIPDMETDHVFGTTENNFRRLIDVFDKPQITDIQKENYKVKIFMEFWKGYDFLIEELVCVANYEDTTYGLGSTAKNQLYYSIDGVTPVASS